jgi:large subunit ribosomal protein L35
MPKMKSNSGAKKRFRFSASGKVKCRRAYRNHILTKKSTKRKRHLRRGEVLSHPDELRVHALLPYG